MIYCNCVPILVSFQTQTQAERKIIEERKEALLKEASESHLISLNLQDKLAELASLKPCPYGTLQAVSFPFIFLVHTFSFHCILIVNSSLYFFTL